MGRVSFQRTNPSTPRSRRCDIPQGGLQSRSCQILQICVLFFVFRNREHSTFRESAVRETQAIYPKSSTSLLPPERLYGTVVQAIRSLERTVDNSERKVLKSEKSRKARRKPRPVVISDEKYGPVSARPRWPVGRGLAGDERSRGWWLRHLMD